MPSPKSPTREDILYVLQNIPSNTRHDPVQRVTAFLWKAYKGVKQPRSVSASKRTQKVSLAVLRTRTMHRDLVQIYRECKQDGVKQLAYGYHELTGFFVIGKDEETGSDKLYGAEDNGLHVE